MTSTTSRRDPLAPTDPRRRPGAPAGAPPEAPGGRPSFRDEVLALPNLLTYGRILLIPPVIMLAQQDTPMTGFAAAVLFAVASITDFLDGWLARRMGLVSVLGRLLDPLADKLLVMATLVVAVDLGRVPAWFVVVLLSRELAISGLRAMASQEGLTLHVVGAGKIKTALQLMGLTAVLVGDTYDVHFGLFAARVPYDALGLALLGVSMVFSLWSAAVYATRFMRAIRERSGARGSS